MHTLLNAKVEMISLDPRYDLSSDPRRSENRPVTRPRKVAVLILTISTLVTACTTQAVSPPEPPSEPPKSSTTTSIPEEKPAGAAQMFSEVAVWGAEPAGDVSFTFPNGIAIDEDDNVYRIEF